jgi:hypothetical protein
MINRSSGQDFYRRFVIRNNVGNEPMDYQQLKDAFLLSGEIEKRVLEFHNERLHLIDTGQSHPSIPDVARYIVHLIPVSAIESATYVDLTRIEERCPNFRFDDPFVDYTRWTVEGYLGWRNYRSDTNKAMTYKLVRNDGVVEIVNTAGFLHEEEKFSPLMARQCIEKIVRTHLKYLAALDVSYPMIVRTALRHVQGWKGWTQDCLHTIKNAIDRPNIHLPEFIIMDSDEDITSYMDRIELTLWNAFGESHERMKKMPHSR